jgi:hypothetical protein
MDAIQIIEQELVSFRREQEAIAQNAQVIMGAIRGAEHLLAKLKTEAAKAAASVKTAAEEVVTDAKTVAGEVAQAVETVATEVAQTVEQAL